MRVIISEKPSMGRDLASALGITRRGEGHLFNETDIVTWCIGHLVELEAPEAYDEKYQRWRIEDLPVIPKQFRYRASDRTYDQFKVISTLLRRPDIDEVVNATDAGREGELIFWLVYSLAGCKRPVRRLWISSLTKDAILDGFAKLKPAEEYYGLRDSAYSRQQSDWLVGMNATRAQTLVAQRAGHKGVYSLGRVQTPTLALIVARDREISEFVPTTYFEVRATFESAKGIYAGTWFNKDGSRLAELQQAIAIVEKVRGRVGTITKLERKAAREKPPLLYDLTALQRAANARFSLSAQDTLNVAQSLYEKKYITYPRTSSRHLSKSVYEGINVHVEACRFGPYSEFADSILKGGKQKLTSRHVDDKKVTDHHAIIPTSQRVSPSALNPDEKRIYDMIVRRFLAAFFGDAEIERTTLITEVDGEPFQTRGAVVKNPGWRLVDPPGRVRSADQSDDEDELADLPPVSKGDDSKAVEVEALTKQTKAPPRYTEAGLLGAMESAGKKIDDDELRLAMKDSGLGTPATRASIIETLLKREYITRQRKLLVATDKGCELIEMLKVPLLKSAELTGQWEKKLSLMARGDYKRDDFMAEVEAMVRDGVAQITSGRMQRNQNHQVQRPEGALDCPKCRLAERSGFLVERNSASGKFLACSMGREICGYLTDPPRNAKHRKALAQTRCHVCSGAMRLRKIKSVYSLACSAYPDCKTSRVFDEKGNLAEAVSDARPSGPPCTACAAPTLLRGPFSNGSYFWGCSRYRADGSGCNAPPVWVRENQS